VVQVQQRELSQCITKLKQAMDMPTFSIVKASQLVVCSWGCVRAELRLHADRRFFKSVFPVPFGAIRSVSATNCASSSVPSAWLSSLPRTLRSVAWRTRTER